MKYEEATKKRKRDRSFLTECRERERGREDGIKTENGKFSPPRNCYSRSIYERDISWRGGEEGSLGRMRRQRKRIPGGGEPIRVYRREKGKVAATARVAENRGARAIYRGFINSNNVPDSLHRFVFSTWIVIDSSLISRLSLEIIRGSVKELLLARFFL